MKLYLRKHVCGTANLQLLLSQGSFRIKISVADLSCLKASNESVIEAKQGTKSKQPNKQAPAKTEGKKSTNNMSHSLKEEVGEEVPVILTMETEIGRCFSDYELLYQTSLKAVFT